MKVKKADQGLRHFKAQFTPFFAAVHCPKEQRLLELATTCRLTDNSCFGGNQNGR